MSTSSQARANIALTSEKSMPLFINCPKLPFVRKKSLNVPLFLIISDNSFFYYSNYIVEHEADKGCTMKTYMYDKYHSFHTYMFITYFVCDSG